MITAQVESLTACFEEWKSFHPEHYEALALNKDAIPLDPDYNAYLERDARGQVLFVALRQSGRMVGYYVGFVAPHLNYRSSLTLTTIIFWVTPSVRDGVCGKRLFRAVIKEATRRGVQRAFFGSKVHQDASVLFEALGFERFESSYSAWLGG